MFWPGNGLIKQCVFRGTLKSCFKELGHRILTAHLVLFCHSAVLNTIQFPFTIFARIGENLLVSGLRYHRYGTVDVPASEK